MSLTEILNEVEKLSDAERKELLNVLLEAQREDGVRENVKQSNSSSSEAKPFKTAFDLAPELMNRLCGKHDSGITDLASNKKHLEGLGRD